MPEDYIMQAWLWRFDPPPEWIVSEDMKKRFDDIELDFAVKVETLRMEKMEALQKLIMRK